MSPYCPTCLGVCAENEVRCPLDLQFLRRRSCRECRREMYPREVYCAECGHFNREPEEVLLLPPEASPLRQFGSLFLDYLTLGVLVFVLLWNWNALLALVLFPILGLGYRTIGRAGGRQTFGQAVFGIGTVCPNAGPAPLGASARRSFFEVLKSPLLLIGRESVESGLEQRTGTLEVSLA